MNNNETIASNTDRLEGMTRFVASMRNQSPQSTRLAWDTYTNGGTRTITDQYRTFNTLGAITATEARPPDIAYHDGTLSDLRDRVASRYVSRDRIGGDDVIRAMDAAARLRMDDEATPGSILAYASADSDSLVYCKPTPCHLDLDGYVKLDDTVPITEDSDFRLASKEFRDLLVNNGLADISDKDNQLIIKIADSMLYKLGKEAAKQKKLASVAEAVSTRAQKMRDRAIKEKRDVEHRASVLNYEVITLQRKVAELEDKLSKSYTKPSNYMPRWITDTIDGTLDNTLLNNSTAVSNRLNGNGMDHDLHIHETTHGLVFNQVVESLARSILNDLEEYADHHDIRIPPEYLSLRTLQSALSDSIRNVAHSSIRPPEVSRLIGDAISYNRPIFLTAFFSRYVTPQQRLNTVYSTSPHQLTIAYVIRTVYRDVEITGSLDINCAPTGVFIDNN